MISVPNESQWAAPQRCAKKVNATSFYHAENVGWIGSIRSKIHFLVFDFLHLAGGITFRKRHATGLSERSDVQRTRPKVPRTITFMTERLVKLSFGTALNSKIEIKSASKICFWVRNWGINSCNPCPRFPRKLVLSNLRYFFVISTSFDRTPRHLRPNQDKWNV